MSRQNGVYRVNCIDCLDRTNVVEAGATQPIQTRHTLMPIVIQSAFARHVLNRQLGAVALLDPSEDKVTRTETGIVFNDGQWVHVPLVLLMLNSEASMGKQWRRN